MFLFLTLLLAFIPASFANAPPVPSSGAVTYIVIAPNHCWEYKAVPSKHISFPPVELAEKVIFHGTNINSCLSHFSGKKQK